MWQRSNCGLGLDNRINYFLREIKQKMKKLLFLLVTISILSACNKEEDRRADDDLLIQNYLMDNGIEAIPIDDTGVYYRITEAGNQEDYPTAISTLRVFYKGYLLDGSIFDQRVRGEHDYLEINIQNVVYGWQVGMQKISKGGKGQIFIPSHAGYGSREQANIPANSVLIFDVELVNVF